MTANLRDQLQATLSGTHTLERELGGGGMSKVFVAEETRLKRKVVVKVLSPELAQGISVDRFEREIQTVAALQQANIVPVISAGDTNGLPFYTMPFVEGESLRARLARGPLAVTEVIGVLRDVSKALAYAHQRGVVHRDIKPDNVLLSGGTAVVTDFGIAKAISASRTASGAGATLTQIGTSIGTPAYMAPEQAAGDPGIDHRADIYSLGAMAYELLSGQPVFANRTPQRMLAAHMGEAPKPISEHRGDLPPALADLVMLCLAKDAAARPQGAGEIARVLESITSGSGMQSAPPVLLGGPAMFRKALAIYAGAFVAVAILAKAAIVGIGLPDWVFPGSLVVMALGLPVILWTGYVQRVARRAMMMTPTYTPGGTPAMAQGTIATMALKAAPKMSWYKTARGGMYAFGTFILIIAAFMIMRQFGIGPFGSLIGKGAFGRNDVIVVADFNSPKGDPTLGATAAEALRTDLAQSRSLKVLTKTAVTEVLRLMKRPTDTEVKFALAREIATREGAKAVLDGDISELGGTYVIAARLVGALDGADLATFRVTAKGQGELVGALGTLSRDIRDKVGESLRNLNESLPLERVTTSSLPALRKYVEGVQLIAATGDNARGRALLMQAVELDSTFAMAWRRLAASYSGTFSQAGAAQTAISKAYQFRENLTETERLLTEAYYWAGGPAPNADRSIAAYEAIIERDSTNRSALNNVAIQYWNRRDRSKALATIRRATMVNQPFGGSFQIQTLLEMEVGTMAAAESVLAVFEKKFPTHADIPGLRAAIAANTGKEQVADSILRDVMLKGRLAEARADAADGLIGMALTAGKVRDAMRWSSASVPDSSQVVASTVAGIRLRVGLDSAISQAFVLNDAGAAKQTAKRALTRVPMEALPPPDRPWQRAMMVAVALRDPAAARAALVGWERDRMPTELRRGMQSLMRGFVAFAEGKGREAAALLADADKNGDFGSPEIGPWRAYALDLAGQPDSATAEFEKYLGFRDVTRVESRYHHAPSHRRLGEIYEAKGDVGNAVKHYAAFVDQWKSADPELQPQVAAVRDRLRKLTPVEKPR